MISLPPADPASWISRFLLGCGIIISSDWKSINRLHIVDPSSVNCIFAEVTQKHKKYAETKFDHIVTIRAWTGAEVV